MCFDDKEKKKACNKTKSKHVDKKQKLILQKFRKDSDFKRKTA